MLELLYWFFTERRPAYLLAAAILAMFVVLKRRKRRLTARGAVLLGTALIVLFLFLIPAARGCFPTIVEWLLDTRNNCYVAANSRVFIAELVIGLGVLIAFTLPKKDGEALEHDEAKRNPSLQ